MGREIRQIDFATRIPAKSAPSRLGISRRTLTNWQRQGLRTFKLGGFLYTSEQAVLDFMSYCGPQSREPQPA